MSSETREKQALVVFVLLILLGMSGLVWYLFAGHSWNVAASNIDDSVGRMEGYTAILYAGTTPAETSSAKKSSSKLSNAYEVDSQNPTSDASTRKGSQSSADDPEKGGESAGSDSVEATQGDSARTESNQEVSDGDRLQAESRGSIGSSEKDEDTSFSDAMPSSSASSAQALDDAASQKSSSSSSRQALEPDAVRESYEEKGAGVLVLDLGQPEIYSEGTIVKRGKRRIGVISISRPLNEVLAKRMLAPFHEAKVDMMVCIAPEKSYLAGISGFDVVVCTSDESLSVIGETSNGSFFVNAPSLGSVGATLVSPSNVVSAKVIDSL